MKRLAPWLIPLFCIAGLASMLITDYGHLNSIWGALIPASLVVLYAFITYQWILDPSRQEVSENAADGAQFLGFLFTLISILHIAYRFNMSEASFDFLDPAQMESIVKDVVIAMTTTIVGIISRQLILGMYLQNVQSDPLDQIQSVTESFGEYLDSFRSFSQEAKEFQSASKDWMQQGATNMKLQSEAFTSAHKSLKEFGTQLETINQNLANLKQTGKRIDQFEKDTQRLDNALTDFCQLVEERIATPIH